MRSTRLAAAAIVLAAWMAWTAPPALATDGPGSVQARAANAAFLATAPAPPEPAAVCVVDSGVDLNTDVAPAVVSRFADDGGSLDDLGAMSDTGVPLPKHGTYVAGVIASQIDGDGSSGIWPRARIVSVRVFGGADSTTSAAAYIRAIDTCTNQPDVKVINLSLAGLDADIDQLANLETAVANARNNLGINVVAAAGNEGRAFAAYPAQLPPVLAVGATTLEADLAPFSNRGTGLDISTLGVDVCLSHPGAHRLAAASGTSFAAPIASATIAALRAYSPAITVAEAEDLLARSARLTAAGAVLDAEAAFRRAGLHDLVDREEPDRELTCSPPPVGRASAAPIAPADQAPDTPDDAEPTTVAQEQRPAPAPINGTLLPATASAAADVHPDRPERPAIRSLRFRGGLLRVEIRGFRPGMTAVFEVDGRRHERSGSVLRLKVRRWRTVRVRLGLPGARLSPALVVRRGREF